MSSALEVKASGGRHGWSHDVVDRRTTGGFTIAELRILLHGFGDAVRLAERWRRLAQ
jgi:hypothetical protein